ncbi:MAG: hypothetical protein KJO77_02410 [Bacteroidia bacterium]|nr:hypothetical protein [Bacteroidia bacterium]NND52945.1 hypothetical protein [Flavobacteriaceae bacterium]
MTLAVLISLFLILVIYLLIAPIHLYVDTQNNSYFIQQKGIVKASFETDKEEIFKLKMKVLFFKFFIYPLKKSAPKKFKKKDQLVPSKKQKQGFGFKKGLRLIKTFKVKTLLLNIDTGDCIKNAKLYPVFALLNYKYGGFNINFDGHNRLVLHMQNRPISIIKSFINP